MSIEEFDVDSVTDGKEDHFNGSEKDDTFSLGHRRVGSIEIQYERKALTTKINSIMELIPEKTLQADIQHEPENNLACNQSLVTDSDENRILVPISMKSDAPDKISGLKSVRSPLLILNAFELQSLSYPEEHNGKELSIQIDKGISVDQVPTQSPLKNRPSVLLEHSHSNRNIASSNSNTQNTRLSKSIDGSNHHIQTMAIGSNVLFLDSSQTIQKNNTHLSSDVITTLRLTLTNKQSEIVAKELLFRSKVEHLKKPFLTNSMTNNPLASLTSPTHRNSKASFPILNEANSILKDDVLCHKPFQGNYQLMQNCLHDSGRRLATPKVETNFTNQSVTSSTKEVGRLSLLSGHKCSEQLAQKCKNIFQNMMSLSSGGSLECQSEAEINMRSTWLYQNVEPVKDLRSKIDESCKINADLDFNQKVNFEKMKGRSSEQNELRDTPLAFGGAHSLDSFQYIRTASISHPNSQEFTLCQQAQPLSKSGSGKITDSHCDSLMRKDMNLFMVNSLLEVEVNETIATKRRFDDLMMREMWNQTMNEIVSQAQSQPDVNTLQNYSSIQYHQQADESSYLNKVTIVDDKNPLVKNESKMTSSGIISNSVNGSFSGDNSLTASNLDLLSFKETAEKSFKLISTLPRFTITAKQPQENVCIIDANELSEDSETEQSFRESQLEKEFDSLSNRHNSLQNPAITEDIEIFNSNHFAKRHRNSDFLSEDLGYDSTCELATTAHKVVPHPSEFSKTKKFAFSHFDDARAGHNSHRQSKDEPKIVVGTQSGIINDSFEAISGDSDPFYFNK